MQAIETSFRLVSLDGVADRPRERFEATLRPLRCDGLQRVDRSYLQQACCDTLAFLEQAGAVGVGPCRTTGLKKIVNQLTYEVARFLRPEARRRFALEPLAWSYLAS